MEGDANGWQPDPMRHYRSKRDAAHLTVASKYKIVGFISSGTYGRVYKAISRDGTDSVHAIKKFKPDKEGDVVTYTGISQSAIREIALNREISHENVVAMKEVILEEKSIYMVFEYAEHDFLQVIHHHAQTLRTPISMSVLKSLTYQLLNGLLYLHEAHIIHRDLKPANILINSSGTVKIGDLGLARITYQPLQPLFAGDKVVVTIWYRAPELLMGARHYHWAVDTWAVGCVVAELASLRPIFKGEEAKMDGKKNVPFQRDQLIKVFEVVGTPDEKDWPGFTDMPEYQSVKKLDRFENRLLTWCNSKIRTSLGYDLLRQLFTYDPDKRLHCREALIHKWFEEDPKPTRNAFASVQGHHIPPHRRITQEDTQSVVQTQAHPAAPPPMHALSHSVMPTSGASFGSLSGGQQTARPKKRARV
ncbi:kinase-like protein [Thelephora ganbajun]|uniref:Kinase-like protein n=1 Tax=Thelephora ganbajun TaxID=370292 RepID=A0ACB6ZF79_THEGA|nr:kinase-like protein [Thelephora ganbajun]